MNCQRSEQLEPILRALDKRSLLDLVAAYALDVPFGRIGAPGLIRALLAHGEANAEEVLMDLLDASELERVCAAFGLAASGRHEVRAGRILSFLAGEVDHPAGARARRRGEDLERWRPFPQARAWARGLGLLDCNEWFAFCRGELREWFPDRPDDIPSAPQNRYGDRGWRGWRDWLGPDALVHDRRYAPFKNAASSRGDLG